MTKPAIKEAGKCGLYFEGLCVLLNTRCSVIKEEGENEFYA